MRPPGRAAIETGQSEICVRTLYIFLFTILIVPFAAISAQPVESICSRPETGTEIVSPSELRSRQGLLRATLAIKNSLGSDGHMRYCYVAEDGSQSPTLRLSPGDLLVLTLKNDISLPATAMKHMVPPTNSCSSGMDLMSASSTNLHFHGLAIPPKCHADETITTADPIGWFDFRVSLSSSERYSARSVLVSPTCAWVQRRASSWGGLRGFDRGRNRAREQTDSRSSGKDSGHSRSETIEFETRIQTGRAKICQ